MTFLQLMQWLEGQLGVHQWPINRDCKELRTLFDSCALHHDLALRLARAIYRANGCQHPRDQVERSPTLAAVIPIRLEVLRAGDTDIDVFHFIEGFCEGIEQALKPALVSAPPPAAAAPVRKIVPFTRQRAKSA